MGPSGVGAVRRSDGRVGDRGEGRRRTAPPSGGADHGGTDPGIAGIEAACLLPETVAPGGTTPKCYVTLCRLIPGDSDRGARPHFTTPGRPNFPPRDTSSTHSKVAARQLNSPVNHEDTRGMKSEHSRI